MDNGITATDSGLTMTVTLDPYSWGDLMVKGLLEAARQIEEWKDPSEVEVWEGIMVAIPYFATPSQMKDLADYQADADWINIVAAKTA